MLARVVQLPGREVKRLSGMKEPDAIVYVIDDEDLVRRGLESLIKSSGLRVGIFSSAR